MRRVAGALGATAVIGTLVATMASSASTASTTTPTSSDNAAETADGAEPPWVPVPEEDFTYPASLCGFEVRAHIIKAEEFAKTVTTFPNGNPQTQLFKGPLIMQFTNLETGTSIERNASGNAFENFGPDGSFKNITIQDDGSHFVGRLPAGSDPGPGIFYVSGEWSSLVINDDGTRNLVLGPNGSAENLCVPLSS
jgi:hypothetical protein